MTRAPQRRRADLIAEIRYLTAFGLSRTEMAVRLGYPDRRAIDAALARFAREGLPDYRGRGGRVQPIRHGTRHAYDRRGCRCSECRACNAARSRHQRASRRLA